MSACAVEPTAIEAAIATLTAPKSTPGVVSPAAMLTRTEPAAMPGQTRGLHRRSAASAMPEGGQTAVA
jgi:hypothetical protein